MQTAGTIVVADDVQANIQLLTRLLVRDGYTVHAALNGAAALELVQRENPDLVLCDVLMPVLNGFDLCRRLKGDRTHPGHPRHGARRPTDLRVCE